MSETTDDDKERLAVVACEKGLNLTGPACSSAYSITDSRYCVSSDDACLDLYKTYQRMCIFLNRPFGSYTDLHNWNATFAIETTLREKIAYCGMLMNSDSDDYYYAYGLDQFGAVCSQLCVASGDTEDDNQIGLILGLSLGLGLPAIGVIIYFLVIRPNQKKNGTKNTVDTEPLM